MDQRPCEVIVEQAKIIDLVEKTFPNTVIKKEIEKLEPFIQVLPESVPEVLQFLRDNPDLQFDFLMSLTGMDMMGLSEGGELRAVYHLFSYKYRHTIVVKADCPREKPEIPTVSHIYPIANWYEREAFDLVGIIFVGHPDLRRILLPQEWEGHPLRKDWKEGPTALGFPTSRGVENP